MAKARIIYKDGPKKWSSYRFKSETDPSLEIIVRRLLLGEHPIALGAMCCFQSESFRSVWKKLYSKDVHSLLFKSGAVLYAISQSKWIDAAFIEKPE